MATEVGNDTGNMGGGGGGGPAFAWNAGGAWLRGDGLWAGVVLLFELLPCWLLLLLLLDAD